MLSLPFQPVPLATAKKKDRTLLRGGDRKGALLSEKTAPEAEEGQDRVAMHLALPKLNNGRAQ